MKMDPAQFAPDFGDLFFKLGEHRIKTDISDKNLRKLIHRNNLPVLFETAKRQRDQVITEQGSKIRLINQPGFVQNMAWSWD